MTSIAQREANQRNAQRSTGPKTAAGKAAAAGNAVKHGLCAQGVTRSRTKIPDSGIPIAMRCISTSHPWARSKSSSSSASRCAHGVSRAPRGSRPACFRIRRWTDGRVTPAARPVRSSAPSPLLLTEQRREVLTTTITEPAQHAAALARATEAESARDQEPLAAAFMTDGQPLAKLSRYETALERSLFRALHALQCLQADRRSQRVSAPAVLDVEASSH